MWIDSLYHIWRRNKRRLPLPLCPTLTRQRWFVIITWLRYVVSACCIIEQVNEKRRHLYYSLLTHLFAFLIFELQQFLSWVKVYNNYPSRCIPTNKHGFRCFLSNSCIGFLFSACGMYSAWISTSLSTKMHTSIHTRDNSLRVALIINSNSNSRPSVRSIKRYVHTGNIHIIFR